MPALKTRSGFTFVELTLSILFLALLSLTVALVVINITSIYTKGLAIKSINSTGSDLIEEFATGINSAPATELKALCSSTFNASKPDYTKCINDNANLFIFNERKDMVHIIDTNERKSLQLSGAFCTGKYSYIWNTGYVGNDLYKDNNDQKINPVRIIYKIADGAGNVNTYDTSMNSKLKNFRLVRIEDPSRVACASQLNGYGSDSTLNNNHYETISKTVYDLTKDATGAEYHIATEPTELIHETENSLALYNFFAAPPSQDSTTNRLFYSGSFVLATLRGGVDITKSGDYCQIQGEAADFEYCAINKFNFAAQATGK